MKIYRKEQKVMKLKFNNFTLNTKFKKLFLLYLYRLFSWYIFFHVWARVSTKQYS